VRERETGRAAATVEEIAGPTAVVAGVPAAAVDEAAVAADVPVVEEAVGVMAEAAEGAGTKLCVTRASFDKSARAAHQSAALLYWG
jgi:hypothetical protein